MAIRLCMLGCGGHATRFLGPALQRLARDMSEVQLAACCDLDPQRTAEYQQRFGFGTTYTDFREMIEREKPHGIIMATPPSLTADLACQVLPFGVPLMMEKPPGRTPEELARIQAAAPAGARSAMVALNRRFAPLIVQVRERCGPLIDAGELHQVHYELVRHGRSESENFAGTAIHAISAAAYLAGSPFAEFRIDYHAVAGAKRPTNAIRMTGRTVAGVQVTISIDPMGGAVTERATVHGRGMSIWLDLPLWNMETQTGRMSDYRGGKLHEVLSTDEMPDGRDTIVQAGFYGEMCEFASAIRDRRPFTASLEAAAQSVSLSHALRESATTWAG